VGDSAIGTGTGASGTVVGARREQRIPRAAVDRWRADRCGVLRERHRVTSLVGEAPDLLCRLLDVEVREDPARDEPVGMRAAPLVDVPVVVGLDHHEVDLGIGTLVEHLPGEPRPVREVEAREITAGRHVEDAGVDLVAPRTHLVVRDRIDVEVLGRLARHRVEAEVAALHVAVPPLLAAGVVGDDTRRELAVLLRHVAVEHVGRLAYVVVDTDEDHVVGTHGGAPVSRSCLSPAGRGRRGGWRCPG
jgi:hypothetical protein